MNQLITILYIVLVIIVLSMIIIIYKIINSPIIYYHGKNIFLKGEGKYRTIKISDIKKSDNYTMLYLNFNSNLNFGLPIGQYIKIYIKDENKNIISKNIIPLKIENNGKLKILLSNNYKLSKYISNYNVNDNIIISGPYGNIDYTGFMNFYFIKEKKELNFEKITIFQKSKNPSFILFLLKYIIKENNVDIHINIIISNNTLLKNKISKLLSKVNYVTLKYTNCNDIYSKNMINNLNIENNLIIIFDKNPIKSEICSLFKNNNKIYFITNE